MHTLKPAVNCGSGMHIIRYKKASDALFQKLNAFRAAELMMSTWPCKVRVSCTCMHALKPAEQGNLQVGQSCIVIVPLHIAFESETMRY